MFTFDRPDPGLIAEFDKLVEYEDQISDLLGEPDSLLLGNCDGAFTLGGSSVEEANIMFYRTNFPIGDIVNVIGKFQEKYGPGHNPYIFLMKSRHMGKCLVLFDKANLLARFHEIKGEIAITATNEFLKNRNSIVNVNCEG